VPERGRYERGIRRREQLLRATLSVIAERGIGATSHRAVAEAAGVPVAATTYYFSSLDEMLEDALRLFVREEVESLAELTAALAEAHGSPSDIIRAVASGLRDESSAAQFDLYVEASRRPPLRSVVIESLDAYRALAEGLLRRVGARDPEVAAPLVVALLDGLGVQHIAVGDGDREQHIIDGLEALLTPFLPGATAASAAR
jgi:TetR/AcrR family transcriptional regulator, regulator of biofilm formation and stress response